ncbi:transmembrane protein 59 [Petromyzon marinus]|uniref:Transmembrane protein 59 n=1 Tax=Petromyzon marinus TaxID=7757 RepID=A0AAJ7TPI2_PETMA|nr:transmembrane protein 59 [Petromyzon marinus]
MDRKGAPLLWLCLAAALSGASAAGDVFDAVLGDAGPCQRACEASYGASYGAQVAGDGHAGDATASENLTRGGGGGAEAAGGVEERERLTLACERGCRLFSICQFVDDGVDLNGTRYECLAACMEAYKRAEEQVACSTGCDNQQPLAVLRQKQLMSMVPRIHFLYPLTLVSSLCGNLMSSAQSFISSSWTFYLQADDGKVVVFQSQPELELEIPNLHLAFGGLMAASQQREKLDQDFLPRLQRVASSEDDVRQLAAEHEAKREERSNSGESSFQLLYEEHAKHDFLSCMSRRSGLPRWILAFTLILSIVVLLWLCCATTATAPDQYIRLPQKLSINGDLQYLKELYLKMPLDSTVPLVSMAMEDDGDEGGPLPAKVAMSHATL